MIPHIYLNSIQFFIISIVVVCYYLFFFERRNLKLIERQHISLTAIFELEHSFCIIPKPHQPLMEYTLGFYSLNVCIKIPNIHNLLTCSISNKLIGIYEAVSAISSETTNKSHTNRLK